MYLWFQVSLDEITMLISVSHVQVEATKIGENNRGTFETLPNINDETFLWNQFWQKSSKDTLQAPIHWIDKKDFQYFQQSKQILYLQM